MKKILFLVVTLLILGMTAVAYALFRNGGFEEEHSTGGRSSTGITFPTAGGVANVSWLPGGWDSVSIRTDNVTSGLDTD